MFSWSKISVVGDLMFLVVTNTREHFLRYFALLRLTEALVRPGKSTIDHSGPMQSDTTPGLTQGVPGAPDVGHETAFSLVEKHRSSLGDEPCSTLHQEQQEKRNLGRNPSG